MKADFLISQVLQERSFQTLKSTAGSIRPQRYGGKTKPFTKKELDAVRSAIPGGQKEKPQEFQVQDPYGTTTTKVFRKHHYPEDL